MLTEKLCVRVVGGDADQLTDLLRDSADPPFTLDRLPSVEPASVLSSLTQEPCDALVLLDDRVEPGDLELIRALHPRLPLIGLASNADMQGRLRAHPALDDVLSLHELTAPLFVRALACAVLRHRLETMTCAQQQTREVVRQTELQYRAMFEHAVEGIFRTTTEGRFVEANAAMARMLGFDSPAELIASVTDAGAQLFVDPERRAELRRRMARDGVVEKFEFQAYRRDRTTVWLSENARAIRSHDGTVLLYEGTCQDVTPRLQAEAALRESEERFRSFMTNTPALAFMKEASGRYLYGNAAWAQQFLRPVEALNQCTDFDLFPSEIAQRFRNSELEVLATGQSVHSVETVAPPQRSPRIWSLWRFPMRSATGQPLVGGIALDITEENRTEERLREANRQLEDALRELGRTQRTLTEQERLRVLGQMASGIVHDFGNSLSAILGYCELQLMRPPENGSDPSTLSLLRKIHSIAQDASTIVHRLRDFYRSGAESYDLLPLDVSRVLAQSVALSRPKWKSLGLASGKTIHMLTECQAVPPILGDEAELRRAFVNLIFNAVDAIESEGTITIRNHYPVAPDPTELTSPSAKGNATWTMIEISDNGRGMTPEERERALEPFFTTKAEHGTGLGLSSVYGIVRGHGGEVRIESQPGRGTTVRIYLPTAHENARAQRPARPVTGPACDRWNVLVVDDDDAVRDVVRETLTREGHRVSCARDGLEGIRLLEDARFDVVITDHAMPGLNGDVLAGIVKKINPNTPVIMVTGFGSVVNVNNERPEGINLFLAKPIHPTAICHALATVMGNRTPIA